MDSISSVDGYVDIDNIDLLHPELLSKAQLYHILKKKNVRIDRENIEEKDKLLEIFYKLLLPMPQRDYRPNRRGTLLMQKRKKCLEKRKCPSSPKQKKPEVLQKLPKIGNEISRITEVSPRVKSPPNTLVSEKKIVRLSSSPCNGSDLALKNDATSPSANSKSKMIRLINETLMSNAKLSLSSDTYMKKTTVKHKGIDDVKRTEDSETVPVKKKHKPITWP